MWGRRGGKSKKNGVDLLHFAYKYKGLPQFNLSFTHDQSMISFSYAEQILNRCGLMETLEAPPSRSPFGLMKFIGGSTIHARSLQHGGKFILGHGAGRAKVDEAQIVPDRTVEEAVMPMLADWDGQLDKSGTPRGATGHFYESYRDGQSTPQHSQPLPGCFSLHCPSWENPFISRRYLETLRGKMTEIQYRTEIGAEFMDQIGRVFPWMLIQACYDVPAPMAGPPKKDHVYVAGWDFAKHLDYTVGYVLDVTAGETANVVWTTRFQKEPINYILKVVKETSEMYHTSSVCVDATSLGGEGIVDQLRGEVANLEAFVFSGKSKPQLINHLKLLMETGRLKFDYDEDLVNELTYYSYELSGRSANVLMGTQKEHDDCVTALALACWAHETNYVEPSVSLL